MSLRTAKGSPEAHFHWVRRSGAKSRQLEFLITNDS